MWFPYLGQMFSAHLCQTDARLDCCVDARPLDKVDYTTLRVSNVHLDPCNTVEMGTSRLME